MRRIIPVLLIEQHEVRGRAFPVVVTTQRFTEETRVGDPVSSARVLASQLADELIVIRREARGAIPFADFTSILERIAIETSMPISVGGGVSSMNEAHALLRSGADKIVVGPSAIVETQVVEDIAERFGKQCVVAAVDIRDTVDGPVAVRGTGRRTVIGGLRPLVEDLQRRGIGEVLLTDVERDGGGMGLNVVAATAVRDVIQVPLILAGGCGRASHMLDAFVQADVDAVAAGTFFASRDQNQFQTRALIANAGVPVRTALV